MTYFDNNATTPLDPVAEKAWLEASRESWHNPSSPYSAAARAHNKLEAARERLARLMDADPKQIVFNSGATEGNNALFQFFQRFDPQGRVVVSAVEHPCVLASARYCFPNQCEILPVNAQGVVDLSGLEALLKKGGIALVSIMAANNETGVVQPWPEVVKLCRKWGVPSHLDAAQWFGKRTCAGMGRADFVTGCAHKFGGPKGVGFIKISEAFNDFQCFHGGGQEDGHRAGTENVPGILAMVAQLEERERRMEETATAWVVGRQVFEHTVKDLVPGVRVVCEKADRLGNTSCLLMPTFPNARWVAQLDRLGFAVGRGSACGTGKAAPSHVLAALGLSGEEAKRAVRVSAGWDTTPDDWRGLATAFATAFKKLRAELDTPTTATVISI
jgi:cysteine desulfurase